MYWPVPCALNLNNIELSMLSHGNGRVANVRANSPSNHLIKAIKPRNDKSIARLDKLWINGCGF